MGEKERLTNKEELKRIELSSRINTKYVKSYFLYSQLFEYENTNLSPAEAEQLKKENEELKSENNEFCSYNKKIREENLKLKAELAEKDKLLENAIIPTNKEAEEALKKLEKEND